MTGDILRIERSPAAKMPPMPIGRTYRKKMSSAARVASGSVPGGMAADTSGPNHAKRGTRTKNDTIEPAMMMAA